MPGAAEVDVPLSVFSVTQLAPGNTVAVQPMVPPATVTRNDPFGLPGAPPACRLNCVPEGASVIAGDEAIKNVTGTDVVPDDEETSTAVR